MTFACCYLSNHFNLLSGGAPTLMQYVTQFRWDYVKCPDSRHLRSRSTVASRAIISPGGWGDKPDGSLWTAPPATVSHTSFPLYVPSVLLLQGGGHSLAPDVLGWPAVLDCRIRLTASPQPSHRTDAGTGHRIHAPSYGIDIEAESHRPGSFSPGAGYHRPITLPVSKSPIAV